MKSNESCSINKAQSTNSAFQIYTNGSIHTNGSVLCLNIILNRRFKRENEASAEYNWWPEFLANKGISVANNFIVLPCYNFYVCNNITQALWTMPNTKYENFISTFLTIHILWIKFKRRNKPSESCCSKRPTSR